MDAIVLTRVAAALDQTFRRGLLREIREERVDRYRLLLETEGRVASISVSLRAELPWIGRPARRMDEPRGSLGRFAVACARALSGRVLDRVERVGQDRVVAMRFAGGTSLVAELLTHGGNLILVESSGAVAAAARHPRSSIARVRVGEPYRPPPLPPDALLPNGATAEEIDSLVRRHAAGGESLFEILRRRVFGVGTPGARLVISESARSGQSPGEVLVRRLGAVARGEADPLILSPVLDLLAEAEEGRLDPALPSLLPWDPPEIPDGWEVLRRADAASTAGLYHDALERQAWLSARAAALQSILQAEILRLAGAEARAASDADSFEDPELHRHWGEAILAGMAVARRAGDRILVPDPYDMDSREISIPAPARLGLAAAAEQQFRASRRARRGIEASRKRCSGLRARRIRLEALAERRAAARAVRDVDALADEMRREGIPVGLEPQTRAGRSAASVTRPRLEGVRILASSEGIPILVGKSAKDNHRLTFRLAGPDDFWFHAADSPGAHVVVRNPRRLARPPQATLEEAAAVSAWFSDARGEEAVDVRWTRRKNVRKTRGAPAGVVALKRFETIRVRPAPVSGDDDLGG